MEHFLAGSPPRGPVEDGIAWRETGNYVEAKVLVQDVWLPIYVITVREGIGAAVSCWDHQFDPIIDNLTKPQIEAIMRRLHPTWFACVDNAIRERYSEGALVELLDPDVMDRKWMIAVLFSHRADDRDHAAGVAMDRVVKVSAEVAEESNNKPSKLDYLRAAAGGAAQGGAQGLALANRIREAAQWISGFTG